MAFDFIGKIKNSKNEDLLDPDILKEKIGELSKSAAKVIEIRVIRSEKEPRRDLLVKSKISVSSMPSIHKEELYAAVTLFKFYLEGIAKIVGGEVSLTDGFYNDDKTYSSLY